MSGHGKDFEGINTEYYQRDFRKWGKDEEISYNNNKVRQREKYRFFQQAYDYLAANFIEGDYYEFGCHKGRTFRMSLSEARKKNLKNIHFYAFDSFEGLPEPKGIDTFPQFSKGALTTSPERFDEIVKEHGLYLDRIHKIIGFFEDTLTAELQKVFLQKKSKIAIAYIDCDMYRSTVSVLNFIEPFLQDGAIVCFDDWNLYKANPAKGERRAFKEFCAKTKLEFEEFLSIGWFGKSFIIIKPS